MGRTKWTGSIRLRRAMLGVVAAALLIAPASASAAGGATFNSATPLAPGTSDFGGIFGPAPVWWTWASGPTPPPEVTLDSCDLTSVDSTITVSTGPDEMSQSTVATAGGGCGTSDRARLKFAPIPSTTYFIRLEKTGPDGNYNLAFNATPANDDLGQALVLPTTALASSTLLNTGATKEALEPDHGGVAGDNSLWYSWTAPMPGGTATVQTCASNTDTTLGVYEGTPTYATLTPVAGTPSPCGSSQNKVVFQATGGTTYHFAAAGLNSMLNPGGRHGTIALTVALPPANDDFANPEILPTTLPVDAPGDNTGATLEAGEAQHAGYESSIWYSWMPSSYSGPVAFDTCGSAPSTATRVDVYTGVGSAPNSPVAGDATSCADGFHGTATYGVTAGTTYLIAVTAGGAGGATRLKLDVPTVPGAGTTPSLSPPGGATAAAPKKCKGKEAKKSKRCRKKRKH